MASHKKIMFLGKQIHLLGLQMSSTYLERERVRPYIFHKHIDQARIGTNMGVCLYCTTMSITATGAFQTFQTTSKTSH